MKTYEEMKDEVFRRVDDFEAEKKRRRKLYIRAAAAVLPLCAAGGAVFALWCGGALSRDNTQSDLSLNAIAEVDSFDVTCADDAPTEKMTMVTAVAVSGVDKPKEKIAENVTGASDSEVKPDTEKEADKDNNAPEEQPTDAPKVTAAESPKATTKATTAARTTTAKRTTAPVRTTTRAVETTVQEPATTQRESNSTNVFPIIRLYNSNGYDNSQYTEMKANEVVTIKTDYDPLMSSLSGIGILLEFDSNDYLISLSTDEGHFSTWDIEAGSGVITNVGKTHYVGNSGYIFWTPDNMDIKGSETEIIISGDAGGERTELGKIYIRKKDDHTLSAVLK